MRHVLSLFIAASVMGSIPCGWVLGQRGEGPNEQDLARIQGTWVVDPATFKGLEKLPEAKDLIKQSESWRFVFDRNQLTIQHPPGNTERPKFTLDATKTPKQIDLSDGVMGIYELAGDNLRICWDKQAKKRGRPTQFARAMDDDMHYYVLRRATAPKQTKDK